MSAEFDYDATTDSLYIKLRARVLAKPACAAPR